MSPNKMKLLSIPNAIHDMLVKVTAISACVMLLLATPSSHMAYANRVSKSNVEVTKNNGKSRAAAKAQSAHGGKVLSVSAQQSNGKTVYKVKLLLDSGRIKIVTVPG